VSGVLTNLQLAAQEWSLKQYWA